MSYVCAVDAWEWILVSLGLCMAIWLAAIAALLIAGRRGDAAALARFIPDCIVLIRRLLADPAVSRGRKLVLLGVVAYLAMPIDLVPDFIPVVGALDDVIVVGLALRVVLRGDGPELLRAHWSGPPESLRAVERFAFG